MRKGEVFPTKWLKAADLNGQPMALKIELARMEPVQFNGREQKKLILYFVGTGKSLTCNATIWGQIERVTGESDSDKWPGHVIEVFPTTTEVKSETYDCIRVRAPASGQGELALAKAPKLPPAPD